MKRIGICLTVMFMLALSFNLYARQSEDLKGVCELSGGTWTGNESGNWACCWDNWGCYGCHSGVCKMQCRTPRCRDANRVRKPAPGTKRVKGLAPGNRRAPVVPMK